MRINSVIIVINVFAVFLTACNQPAKDSRQTTLLTEKNADTDQVRRVITDYPYRTVADSNLRLAWSEGEVAIINGEKEFSFDCETATENFYIWNIMNEGKNSGRLVINEDGLDGIESINFFMECHDKEWTGFCGQPLKFTIDKSVDQK